MKKLIGLVIVVVIAAVGVFVGLKLTGFSHTLSFTEAELQEKIDPQFPLEKSKGPLTLTLDSPEVSLREDVDRIGVKAHAKVSAGMIESLLGDAIDDVKDMADWTVAIDGRLDYDPETGTLYFVDPVVRDVQIKGLPEAQIGNVTELATELVGNKLGRIKLYTLDESDVKQRLARLSLKSVEVSGGKLLVTLGL